MDVRRETHSTSTPTAALCAQLACLPPEGNNHLQPHFFLSLELTFQLFLQLVFKSLFFLVCAGLCERENGRKKEKGKKKICLKQESVMVKPSD